MSRNVHSDPNDLWRPRVKRLRNFTGEYKHRAPVQKILAKVLADEPDGFPTYQHIEATWALPTAAVDTCSDNHEEEDDEVVILEQGNASDPHGPLVQIIAPDPTPPERPNHIAHFLGSRKRKRETEGLFRRTRQLGNSSSKREFLVEWRHVLPSGEKITWVEEAVVGEGAQPLMQEYLRAEQEEGPESEIALMAIPLAGPETRRTEYVVKTTQDSSPKKRAPRKLRASLSSSLPPTSPVSPARIFDEPQEMAHTPRRHYHTRSEPTASTVQRSRRYYQTRSDPGASATQASIKTKADCTKPVNAKLDKPKAAKTKPDKPKAAKCSLCKKHARPDNPMCRLCYARFG